MRATVAALGLFAFGCVHPPPSDTAAARPSFAASRVRSFTDAAAVTAVADGGSVLWVGTTRGLYRWDLAQGRFTVVDRGRVAALATDGKGAVWVATPKGVRRGAGKQWESFPPAPVGDFVTGLVPASDRKSA